MVQMGRVRVSGSGMLGDAGGVGEMDCCGEESVESSSNSFSFGGDLCW